MPRKHWRREDQKQYCSLLGSLLCCPDGNLR